MAIEAVIFDMDGVLIDSEELWREAEAAVFRSVGIPMTAEDGRQTMGLRSDEVVGKSITSLDVGFPIDELRKPLRQVLDLGAEVQETMPAHTRRGRPVE